MEATNPRVISEMYGKLTFGMKAREDGKEIAVDRGGVGDARVSQQQ